MINIILMTSFRNMTESRLVLKQSNLLRGANGVGKSTVKESLAFVFCGTDSYGNKTPRHLIQWGKPFCEVTVITDKVTLQRKLLENGTSTLKLTRADVTTTITQTQLEQMIGPPDAFMSVFYPGYFFTLPVEKQQKVLMDLCPPIDRKALLESLLGFKLSAEDLMLIGLNRRPDLVAATAGMERRSAEKSQAFMEGELKGLEGLGVQVPPTEPAQAVATMGKQRILKDAWDSYTRRGLEILKAELRQVQSKKLPEPSAPAMAAHLDTDYCPTCGQIVSSKHREKVTKINIDAREKFDQACQEVMKHNQEIERQVNDLYTKIHQVEKNEKHFMDGMPGEQYSSYDHHQAEQEYRDYLTHLSAYKTWEVQRAKANETIDQLKLKIQSTHQVVEKFTKLEKALQELPKRELYLQEEALSMGDKLKIDFSENHRVRVYQLGVPYEALSDGQKLQAAIELSRKLNSLMKNPLNVLFIENSDLVDNDTYMRDSQIQWIVAKVAPGVTSLQVE